MKNIIVKCKNPRCCSNMVRIPYNYKANHVGYDYFTLNDFNIGIIGCKRLGYNPKEINLGQKEIEEISGLCCSNSIKTGIPLIEEVFGVKITKVNRYASLFIFLCEEIK